MDRNISRALLLGTSLLAGATPFANIAVAQTAATTPADASKAGGIQEIVVTANRVETKAQKTATALTVYGGGELLDKGVNNIAALETIDPSINVTTSTGSTYVALRGIASTDTTEIGDPSVPIARDGFYVNRSYAIQTSLYDLARIEVLKGPQGTLNGRNSTGGLISIITNRPDTARDGGYVAMGVGNYGAFHSEGAANIALSDTFAVRATSYFDYHSGYRHVTGVYNDPNERGDDNDAASGRIQALWRPIQDMVLWASYQHDSIVGVGDLAENLPIGVVTPLGDGKTFAGAAPTSVDLKDDRARWEVQYNALPGGLKFIYTGGYDVVDYHHHTDATQIGANAYPAYQQFIQHEHPKTWNHEARISNDVNSRLFVQAGYFHFQEVNTISSGVYDLAMMFPFSPGGPLAALSQAGNYGIFFQYPQVIYKSDAGFGYATYRLADQLKMSGGVRYTADHKTRTGFATINLAALASPFIPSFANPPPTPGNGEIKEHKTTFHAGLDYTPGDHSLIYAKFDTGYKPGGFNSNGQAPSVNYAPETVSTAEIGTKNRFMDNRLELNVDGFYSDYKGYQASQFTTAIGNGAAGVQNIGNAKIYGAEVQVVALFGTGGQFDFNGAALHTKFGAGLTASDASSANPDIPTPIGGNHLPNAPSFSFTAGLQQAVTIAGGTVTGRVEGKYSSSFYYSIFNTPDTQSGSYMTGNALLTYKPSHGDWQIEAYVRNFTDKLVLANAARNPLAYANNYEFQPPRTFGLNGRVKF